VRAPPQGEPEGRLGGEEPQRPHGPRPRRPGFLANLSRFPATFGLIGFTLLVYLGQLLSVALWGQDVLLALGAKERGALAAGQVWRLVSPIFLHIGLLHFFVNMYSLYALGPAVERFFGGARMLLFYLLSGISGVILSDALSSRASVGASGAIFGLLGALAAFLYQHRRVFGSAGGAQFRQLVFVALLNLAIGLSPGIDNWGHLGGLLSGAIMTWFLGPQLRPSWGDSATPGLVDRRPWRAVRSAALVSAAAILALGLAIVKFVT
jgi:rhomboid protease GluP